MLKITVQVDGMMCGMCESHVNDAVRKAFQVKKVTSSHSKGQTVILTEIDIDEGTLCSAIGAKRCLLSARFIWGISATAPPAEADSAMCIPF